MSDVLYEELTQGESSAEIASGLAVNSPSADEMPPVSEKGSDAGQGNRFQSKLLTLFCIRAINAGYKFYLGTELFDQGNKFDDLIFKYTKDEDAENKGENWPYQYLQAKSRLNEKENKITAKDLFAVPTKEKKKREKINIDFSLPKYFRSYREIIRRGDKIDTCIICTNIDFEKKESLKRNGIEVKEVQLTDKILQFAKLSDDKNPTRCKLDISKEKSDILKEETTSKILAEILLDSNDGNETKKLCKKSEVIRNYHIALIKENVIDLKTKKLHEDFIKRPGGLTEGAKELRINLLRQLDENIEKLNNLIFSFDKTFGKTPLKPKIFNYSLPVAVKDEEIKGFLDKLIFAVNTPNEGELDDVIKSEVGNYFTLLTSDLQSAYVMNEMVNWFKRKDNIWLSSQEARTLFLDKTKNIMESIRLNDLSNDYQDQLKKDLMGLEFNRDSIQIMTEKLELLFKDTSNSVIVIGSESPQHTAVKFIAAIKTLPDFKCDDSFLVTPSKRLNDEVEAKKFKNCFELNKEDSHNLLVVVCDGDVISAKNCTEYASIIPTGRTDKKINKVVIICLDKSAIITDEIKFTELTDEYKIKIMSQKVSFQPKKDLGQQDMENKKITVGDLIGDKLEEVIDINSIKELTQLGRELIIPSFDDTTHFDEQMYIKRKLKFPFYDKFEDEIAKRLECSVTQLRGECSIRQDGHIEWLVDDKRQKEIWDKILDVANQSSSLNEIHEDDRLIPLKEYEKEKSIVIISGEAGTGKSTILSHCYQQIKQAKPDHWVIRINLVDHYEAILKLDNITLSNAVDIFINELHVVDEKSSFSRSLLRNRLETGERIVVMFDGFDEINELCQDKAIELMKVITKNNSIQLYVTTRPHLLDKLQFQLSQLSYNLANFERNDQIDFLIKYWEKELNLIGDKNGPIQQFAESLIDRVSETLKDKESSFIGIPLQCRIVAECFQPNFSAMEENYDKWQVNKLIADLLDGQSFDLANLYRRLLETKRRVFLEEKAKIFSSSVQNDIVVDAINQLIQDVEGHLTKIAIETIATNQKHLEILWSHQSLQLRSVDEIKIALNSLKFGLTFKGGAQSRVQFLHRTYAEYLFARYLYEGFLLDEKRHNKLLENESIRMLILKKILARPEYHGVQVFFNSMLKELVEDDEEWRNRIDNRNLPETIKKLTENFYAQYLPEDLPPLVPDTEVSRGCPWTSKAYQRYDTENALHFSLGTGKAIIFTFLCDCLDATLDQKQVRIVMMKSFMHEVSSFKFSFFRQVESKYFKRFLDYVDSEADKVMSKFATYPAYLPPCDLEYSQWNGEEQKKTVHHLLQFMTNQREAFDKHFRPHFDEYVGPHERSMLNFFIFNENYDSHLKIFLGLLSRSTAYSDDSKFENLLKKTFCSKEHFNSGRIEKVLITLRKLKRQNLLIQLYGIVLAIEPESFQNIYQPPPIEGDSVGKEVELLDLNILMKRDSYRMTIFHRAAFHGNTKAIEGLLGKIRQNLNDPVHKKVSLKIINKVMARDEYGFTPFYVAAVRGQEEIYHKMLTFLKEILPNKKLKKHFTDPNGFVRHALSDAIESENIQMFNLILVAVKKELGQNKLLQILRLPKSRYSSSLVSACFKTKKLFCAMAIAVMRKDNVTNDTDFKADFYNLVIPAGMTTEIQQYIVDDKHQGKTSFKDFNDYENEYKMFEF
jgi:hypothetical protein